MELNLLPENPLSAANLSSAMVGSAPGDRMKMSGAQQLESTNDLVRSNGGGSTKLLPSFSVTKFVTAGTTCTNRINCTIRTARAQNHCRLARHRNLLRFFVVKSATKIGNFVVLRVSSYSPRLVATKFNNTVHQPCPDEYIWGPSCAQSRSDSPAKVLEARHSAALGRCRRHATVADV